MKRGMVPNVYFRNPHMTVSSRGKPGIDIQAKVVEAIDNWLIQEMGIKQIYKTMVQDCYYTDRGIAKIGYDGAWANKQKSWWKLGGDQTAEEMGVPISSLSKKGHERVGFWQRFARPLVYESIVVSSCRDSRQALHNPT